ncbi:MULTISPECIES: hypothetical protein [unclassified Streptomyces]|uniref:hypothetical protein n=1 Tax=unclassified Streptomyces TaxID=2593676 RepID=UPI002E7FFC46|nr:hypothetical protein [Streptomyces sp. NBC_00589]WTI33963.1 hypothetical protein OIC96_02670 [Streptomyces sp. NBC_00775]WUB32364.1 hypothetical protein OHA51_47060 [Streptomyces sp. NBC_00589]
MHTPHILRRGGRALRREATRPNVLFGGVYGAVLASSMVAALTQYGPTAREVRLYDAQWLLFTAFASASAHGYAHIIARRGEGSHPGLTGALRLLLDEWPLVMATLPTVVILLGAGWGWWPSEDIEYEAFAFNIVFLFGWGLTAARAARRPWRTALVMGSLDALLGVIVVVANALIK